MQSALISAVRERASGDAGPVLARLRATVVLDAGDDGAVTISLERGTVTVTDGRPRRPTTLITADLSTLLDIVEGRTSGVTAYLERRIRVRGNLALSLQLDGVFPRDDRPDHFPRAGVTEAHGVRTAYVEAGPPDAPVVVALHGLGATNASLLPTLADLARDHRVIAPDLPGHGASSAPAASYDAAFFADWLRAFLDELSVERAVLLGNSLGGRIAIEGALALPERTTALVLFTPAAAFRKLRQFIPLVRVLKPGMAALPLPMTHRMAAANIRRMFARPERLPQESYEAAADEFVRVFRRRPHRVAFFSALRQIYLDRAFGDDGFWTRLPRLTAPALFIWGEHDRLVPAGFARHVVEAVPHATSVVLPDCGHVPQFELPERTHQLVREFLTDVAAAGPSGPEKMMSTSTPKER